MNHHPTHRWIVAAAAAISISLSACGHVLAPVLGASAVPVDLVEKVQRPVVDPEMRRFERLKPPAVDPELRRYERLVPGTPRRPALGWS